MLQFLFKRVIGFGLLGLFLIMGTPQTVLAHVQVLQQGDFIFSDSASPPSAPALWHPVHLPDNWTLTHPDQGGIGWYRLPLEADQHYAPLTAVYLPRLSSTADVYLNGQLIGSGGDLHSGTITNTFRPLLFTLPSSLLHPAHNEIEVRLVGYANESSGLSPLQVGPARELMPVYDRQMFLEVTAPSIAFGLLLLLSSALFILWWRHRQQPLYLMFALCGYFSCGYTAAFFVQDHSLISHNAWIWWIYDSVFWYVYCVMLVIHRFVQVHAPKIERWLLGYTLLATLLISLYPASHRFILLGYLGLVFAALSVYVLITIYRHRHAGARQEWTLLFCAITFSALTGYHDIVNLIHPGAAPATYYFYWGSTVLGIAIALLLLLRFDHSLTLSESMNRALHFLVEQKTQELQQSFQERQILETRQAVFHERERIMRDLHDGLGGYLVSALVQSEKAVIPMPLMQQTLRAALNDLRLMIDSLDTDPADILTQLGSLRERLESCMEASGTLLHWAIADNLQLPHANSNFTLQMSRMIQEIFTNIAKHSHAQNAYFTLGLRHIEIRDDGCGFNTTTVRAGRGLPNLQQRANQIGINLDITSSPQGTRATLTW